MKHRILTLFNLLMIAICGASVFYLATAQYEQPVDIKQANDLETTTDINNPPPPPPPSTPLANLSVNVFQPFYTPTPSPTPGPTPEPPPPDLQSAVYTWHLRSLDENKATFEDTRPSPPESFDLIKGGPPREAMDKDKRPVEVQLMDVDLNEFKAILGFGEQTVPKPLE